MSDQKAEKRSIVSTRGKISLLFLGSLLYLSACSPHLQVSHSEKKLYPIDQNQPVDSSMLAFYRPYKQHLDSQMNKIVATSAIEIEKAKPEGPLNNLMADAMYEAGKLNHISFDVAYTNYGGLRIPLPKGDIPLFKVFELMPFENLITTVKFKGTDMQEFFNYIAQMGGDAISGARFKIKDKKAVDIFINGKPLDLSREYIVLTSDYMANGGDGGDIFFKATDRKDYELKLRDALLIYLEGQTKAGKTLNPQKDGRITIE
ncbi:MAG TPA: 5'-nucleotidase C-terminal domain-containing protein [Daejeonella sp.]|nr:5'-nucleotidase C-terminal domain-containing protein [Daejeonella sp.]